MSAELAAEIERLARRVEGWSAPGVQQSAKQALARCVWNNLPAILTALRRPEPGPRPEADDGVADTALLDALEGRRWVIYPGLDEGWSVVEVCATSDPAGPEENEVATTTGSVRDALRAALAAAQEGAR